MRIDRTHRSWMFASLMIVGAATLVYIPYAMSSPAGPRGGSGIGLGFGVVGYAFMLFAGLLGARKKVPVWRIGRAQTWMRGHLWLGLLSLPLIVFHAGFAWRGPLTGVLMLLLVIVVVSGLTGAALQHYLPRVMTERVPLETIYEEIPHVRSQLLEEAEQLVASISGPRTQAAPLTFAVMAAGAQIAAPPLVDIEQEEKSRFRDVYAAKIRPYLENPDAGRCELRDASRSAEIFLSLRQALPLAVHPMLNDLESICDEERQFSQQEKLYGLLHGWLLVHVPLSIGLLVLGGIHAVVALRY